MNVVVAAAADVIMVMLYDEVAAVVEMFDVQFPMATTQPSWVEACAKPRNANRDFHWAA